MAQWLRTVLLLQKTYLDWVPSTQTATIQGFHRPLLASVGMHINKN